MDRRVKERLIGATILVALIVLIVPELLSGPRPAPLPPPAAGLPSSTRNVSVNLSTSKATPQPQAADAATEGAAARETPGTAQALPAGSSASGGGAGASTVSGAASEGASAEASAPGGASGAGAGAGAPGSSAPAASGALSAPTVATLKAQESAASLETATSSPRSPVQNAAASDSVGARGQRGWAVQLGSFASKANAEKLLHQMPGSGFYLVSSGSGASLRYRVRMGPLADRGAAERAVTKLKAQGHAATIVAPAA